MHDPAIAERRLAGTPWGRVPLAVGAYRACVAAGSTLAQSGISANALTYGSLALAAGAALAAALGAFAVAAILILASGALDLFDGVVARASGTSSRWGALLDSTVDRASDGLPLVGLVVFYASQGPLAAIPSLAMLSSFMVSYVRARAEALGTRLPPLFMRRPERVLLLTLALFAGLLPCDKTDVPAPLTLFGLSVLLAASSVGTLSALRAARIELDERAER